MAKKVILYTRKQCPLCEEAKALILMIQRDTSFTFEEMDIYQDDALLEKYQMAIPVVDVDGKQLQTEEIDYFSLSQLIEKE